MIIQQQHLLSRYFTFFIQFLNSLLYPPNQRIRRMRKLFYFRMMLVLCQFHFSGFFRQMSAEQVRKKTKIFLKKVSIFGVCCVQHGMEFNGKISGVIYHSSQKFSPFPPAVIGGISPENQKHRQDKTQQRVDEGNIFNRRILVYFKIFYLQKSHYCRIYSHGNHP